MGMNAKMIITGDVTQIDLPRAVSSGLVQALKILRDIPGIGRVEFGKKDIVRHQLVQRIVEAYQAYDEANKGENNKGKRRESRVTALQRRALRLP